MTEKSIETVAAAVKNPTSQFDSPQSVVEAEKLSLREKAKVLDAWEEDARRLAVATEEGMSGGEPSRLAEVAEAKAELGLTASRRPTPTKTG